MFKVSMIALSAALLAGMFSMGCETSHTEKDSPTILGGQKHEETTTYKNPITGDTSTEHSSQKTGL